VDHSAVVALDAAARVQAIRAYQPRGPYCIAGYSLSGLVAYEVARRLRADGEEVVWLGLIDAGTPVAIARSLTLRGRIAGRRHRRGLLLGPPPLWRLDFGALRAGPMRYRRSTQHGDQPTGPDRIDIALGYQCAPHDAPMHVFTSADRAAASGSPSLGWEGTHRGSLTVHRVQGDHETMVLEPQVAVLAAAFARSLGDVQVRRQAEVPA
jgi:thioesterase domain-containing protein